ncbi:unnamed protein product [Rangifer tarandus platyrhynchus]|uniref:Uncharacterized protein n=2 Tax=Rangifer tarandus platyrhynchus TaxID=3082113 RepID=A0ABN8Y3A2_RANTA|nr:unnamed protein product [Rangifer tarandus platyrhynchus]
MSTWKVRSTLKMGETPLEAWKDTLLQSDDVLFADMLNRILQTFQHCPYVGFFKLSEIGPLRPCGLCFWDSCVPVLLYQRSRTSGEGPTEHLPGAWSCELELEFMPHFAGASCAQVPC